MTNKEILTKLFDRCLPCVMSLTADQEQQIIKDLEVLEVLKDSITDKEAHMIVMKDEITEKMKGEEFMILHYTIKGTKKVNKVKEWLNDK